MIPMARLDDAPHPLGYALWASWALRFHGYGFRANVGLNWRHWGFPDEIKPGWFLAYKDLSRNTAVYAVAPLHLVLRLWARIRYWRHLFFHLGFLDAPEGESFGPGEGRWSWNPLPAHRRRLARLRQLEEFGAWRYVRYQAWSILDTWRLAG